MRTLIAALALAGAVSGQAADKPAEPTPSTTSRTVGCHDTDVISVNAEVNYATLIQFASGQTVVGAFWGDTDRWSVDKQANILLVKPSVKGTRTDIHVVTSGGAVCSFSVAEVSNDKGQPTDLKLRVTTPNDHKSQPVFYTADQVAALKQTAADAQHALEAEKAAEQKRIAQEKQAARTEQEAAIKHGYRFDQNSKLAAIFHVTAIYRDDKFTYIEATPQEAPALYEIKDGKPSLIQYEFRDGKYIVPKLLNQGYLKVGKSKLNFTWEG
jgi:type IV secretory pathway VirB9-like protein